ncbi:methyltransferase family protein [Knoellia sp. CPCC 206453]|uniref:methyltransferase family protein n=1 Tax=Knoellia pratensis TaxID=3404796 RepID=UPI0036222CA8
MDSFRGIDLGRLILVPLCVALIILNTGALLDADTDRSVLQVVSTIAALAFYTVLTVMYLGRGVATRTDRRPDRWLVAGLATFSGYFVPLVGAGDAGEVEVGVGSALIAVGVALSIWALLHLRTNISVVPQSRDLASSGPYRVFRHPLYVFEYISAVGLAMVHGGGWAWAIVIVLAVLQILRARWEEALLHEQVEGYAAYAARTRGFS